VKSISVSELNLRLKSGDEIQLLDIREPYERKICAIPNSEFIPMDLVAKNPSSVKNDGDIVVYCHHGIRSFLLIKHLEEKHGYGNLINLDGGINEWALKIDQSMPRY
jgi:adenylyltransferase/sulfurtransferase